jgi:hypothetical protein
LHNTPKQRWKSTQLDGCFNPILLTILREHTLCVWEASAWLLFCQ